ncbi:MAG: YiiD C-terminal domain-containing protein [Reinekea sp.]
MNLDAIEPLQPLGIKVKSCDGERAVITMPQQGNLNDKKTIFAGSQYSAMVIAGWYLAGTWAEQNGLGDKVAIKDGQVSYPKAAVGDLEAIAQFQQPPEKRPSGHWRVEILVEAFDSDGDVVSRFVADYRILQ